MGLTKLNFNEVQNASEALTGININTNINFKEQISIPIIPPSQDLDGVLWVDPSAGTFKSRINLVNYTNSFKTDLNSIVFSSPNTLSLGGNTGIVNDLTISGTNTVLNVRSNAFGTAQWSILEVQGNLTVASGSTLNLIRTPLIVRGNIIGDGIISSPDGVNGGLGGIGGPGGIGGTGGTSQNNPGTPGSDSINIWQNKSGSPGIYADTEYGISGGTGGSGGKGSAGGGGSGGYFGGLYLIGKPGFPPTPPSNIYLVGVGGDSGNGFTWSGTKAPNSSWGGGGAGGNGSGITGGPAAIGSQGNQGFDAGQINSNYIGTGKKSNYTLGTNGISGGGGANGVTGPSSVPNDSIIPGIAGSPGGVGGNGGAGGGTGGSHLSIYAAGTISSSIKIRPGKGGLTGGSTSLPRAETGSAWLFTINNTSPIDIDLTGAPGTPNGASGTLNRILISNSSGVSNFYSEILFEPNGITPAKNKIYLTSS